MAKKKSTIFNEQQFFNRLIKTATATFLHEVMSVNKETDIEIMGDFLAYIKKRSFINIEKCKKYNSNFSLNVVNEIMTDLSNFLEEYFKYIKNNPNKGIDSYKICEKFIKEKFVSEINETIDIDIFVHVIHMLYRGFCDEGIDSNEFILNYGNIDCDTKKSIKNLMLITLQCSILIGMYVFVTVEKPKNNFIKTIKKDRSSGKLKYEYSSIKVVDQEEISLYRDGAGFYYIFDRFMSKNKTGKFFNYLYTIIKMSVDIYGEDEYSISVWNVGVLVPLDMPFVEITGNSLDDMTIRYKDKGITDNIVKAKTDKKYAFPVNGCDVEIVEEGTYVKSMSIDYVEGEYIFKVILNGKWFESDDAFAETVFVVPKLKFDELRKNFKKDGWDKSLFYYSNKSTLLKTEEDKIMVTKLAINIFLMHTIYCIENEIKNSQIVIRNKTSNENRRRLIKKSLCYRTAIVEKENENAVAFYNKKYYATDNDGSDKYIVDDGYIYVKECDIYYEEIIKKFIEI